MHIVQAERGKAINLGREGENLARQVIFDVYEWQEMYGDGVVQLIAQRMGDAAPYPCVIEMDGNHVIWTITSADTAVPSRYGKCELSYRVNDVVVKSETFATVVADAMGEAAEEAPEPYKAWVDQVLKAGTTAQNAAERAEYAMVHAPIIQSGNWWVWDVDAGAYVDTGVVAKASQADWEENDTTSIDHIKNRPFYLKEAEMYIEEETVDISADDGTGLMSASFVPVEGETYVVYFNGVAYTCVAYGLYREDGSFTGNIALGNIDVSGEANMEHCENKGNGEPFAIETEGDGRMYVFVSTFSGLESCTIKITGEEITIVDERYKKAINLQSDWEQEDETAPDFIKHKPAIPAAQVPSDWNQNDSAAPDYVKNRPFYAEDETVIVEEQWVETEDSGDGAHSYVPTSKAIEAGEAYFVTYNEDTVYECVAEAMNEDEWPEGYVVLGNGKFLDGILPGHGASTTNHPFAIFYEGGSTCLVATEDEMSFYIKVTSAGGVVIDPAYAEAIKATLPTLELTATLEDGTTATYTLFGEVVTE